MNNFVSNLPLPDIEPPKFDFSHIKCKWLNVPYADKSSAEN